MQERMPEPRDVCGTSRRGFLQLGAATVATPILGGLLSACGGGDGASSDKRALNTILWSEQYELSKPFEEKFGIKIRNRNAVDPVQSANMVKASPGEFDVVSFGPFDSPEVYDNMALPLDPDRIKDSWDALYPYFQTMWDPAKFAPSTFDGQTYHISYQWGSTVLAWNTKRIKETPKSWRIMMDPKYKGKTSFNDQSGDAYATMRLSMGKEPNAYTAADFKETEETAGQWFENAKTLWSTGDDIKQLMVQEEVWVAHIWDGTARQMLKEGYPIDYTYPEEGVRGSVDGPGIMKGSKNIDDAYDLCNYMMTEEFGIRMGEEMFYASGNRHVADKLKPDTQKIMRLDQMGKLLSDGKLILQKMQGPDFEALDAWWRKMKLKFQA
ncbi:MAG: PotD/PotF family extracellular solute-binding protein [Nocardioidaceae bacterium]